MASSRWVDRRGRCTATPSTAPQASNSAEGVTGLISSAPTASWRSARRRNTSSRLNAVSISTVGVGWRPPSRRPSRYAHSTPSRPGIFQSSSITWYGSSAASAAATLCKASWPSTAVSARRPSARLIADSISRAPALSSTISTRLPCRPGWPASTGWACSAWSAKSRLKWKRLPVPQVLSTSISPPINRTRCRLMASPRPVPP